MQRMTLGEVKRISRAKVEPKSTLNCVPEMLDGARIVMRVPPEEGPTVGVKLPEVGSTMNSNELLFFAATVTLTGPVFAPFGAFTWMRASVHDCAAPVLTEPNRTVLFPCVAPKFLPTIVIVSPTFAADGFTCSITGAPATCRRS